MQDSDALQRFIFADLQIRGELVRLNTAFTAVNERHPYPSVIKDFLGQALAASVLLRANLKYTGSLTLQIEGDGPVSLIVAQCNEKLHIRGLAKWESFDPPAQFANAVGQGYLAITITPNEGERYQGVVKLGDPSLSDSLMSYFTQSEQLNTFLMLATNETQAVGLLLQVLPASDSPTASDDWQHVLSLAQKITKDELLNTSNQELLLQVFPELSIQLFAAQPAEFYCSCNLEKMESALQLYGFDEVIGILTTNRYVKVTCEFCNKHYDFSRDEIERIFERPVPPLDKPN